MSEVGHKKKDAGKVPSYRIVPDGPWANAWKLSAVLGAIGIAASVFGAMNDSHRFAFSWLFAFMTFLAVGLGGLFYVLGQHLTGAGWGVTARRTSEFMMIGLPVFALLFIPILLNLDELYPWMHHESHDEATEEGEGGTGHGGGADDAEHGDEHHGALSFGGDRAHAQAPEPEELPRSRYDARPSEWPAEEHHEGESEEAEHTPQHAEHHEIIESKLGYFHLGHTKGGFFMIRAAVYFLLWTLLALFFFSASTRQDKDKDVEQTKRMQRFAPPATFVFALSLTFAVVDWVMSLEPGWYSTIFGVQYFAGSAVAGFAVLLLLTLGLRRSGLLGEAVNVEHFHDLGKLQFGFIVFWAYISFSQFMLIWYAGIPEEATYYHLRWWGGGGFRTLSLLLVFGHFVVPFFLIISRNAKRRLPILFFGAAWIAVMHVMELYWLVMPYANQTGLVSTSLSVHWMDIAALFAVGGTYMSVVLWMMTRYPLIPVGDPRLHRALSFQNA